VALSDLAVPSTLCVLPAPNTTRPQGLGVASAIEARARARSRRDHEELAGTSTRAIDDVGRQSTRPSADMASRGQHIRALTADTRSTGVIGACASGTQGSDW
jgi:hypothetical protein